VTPRLRLVATGMAVALIGLLAACGGPFNTLATSDSICFRGLPVAKAAVHAQGTLVGVRRVQTKTLESKIEHKLHETDFTLAPAVLSQETQLCAFAFRGQYAPGAVDLASNTQPGKYAVVLVGSKHVVLVGAVVLPALPQRFRHPHVKP
jgi:hypothetical protein